MIAMTALLIFVLALGLAAAAGWTADSREPEHGLWPLRQRSALPPIPVPSTPDSSKQARRLTCRT